VCQKAFNEHLPRLSLPDKSVHELA